MLTQVVPLKGFLEERAKGLMTNDYALGDGAWLDLQGTIEPVLGPYRVDEDRWFGYKAAFEAVITLADDPEMHRLARLNEERQDVQNNLPIDEKYRRGTVGIPPFVRVVNTVFSAGGGDSGVQRALLDLPTNERIVAGRGAKRLLLKNIYEAKFRMILQPISKIAFMAGDQPKVTFDAFFTHILIRESMRGLGPRGIASDRTTTARQKETEINGAIEEATADISGLYAFQFLVDRGKLDRGFNETMYTSFLASQLASLRSGLTDPQAASAAIQVNYFLDNGGITLTSDGVLSVNPERMRQNVLDFTRDLMMLQATGGTDERTMIAKRADLRPAVKAAMDRLKDVPLYIAPRFVTGQQLLSEAKRPGGLDR